MKRIAIVIMILCLFGCKSQMEKVRDFDMTRFCGDYTILVNPGNDVFYIFISKQNREERFIIYKDMDKEGSGYGFCFSHNTELKTLLKNGVFKTAEEAVERGKRNYDSNGTSLWLNQLMKVDDREWLVYGQFFKELCP